MTIDPSENSKYIFELEQLCQIASKIKKSPQASKISEMASNLIKEAASLQNIDPQKLEALSIALIDYEKVNLWKGVELTENFYKSIEHLPSPLKNSLFKLVLIKLQSTHPLSSSWQEETPFSLLKNKIVSKQLTDPLEILVKIKFLGIANQQELLEIAKLCADQDGLKTAIVIHHFGIEDEKARLALAKTCAKVAKESIAKFIPHFNLNAENDPQELFSIAQICANKKGKTAEFIKNFGVKDEGARIQLAWLCLQNPQCKGLAHNIKNFLISPKNQKVLIELAVESAKQNGIDTAECISNFGIDPHENKQALIEIAKICAKKIGGLLSEYIQEFGIKDQQALFELAKVAIEEGLGPEEEGGEDIEDSLKDFGEFVKNFSLASELDRIEIAKMCARKNGSTVAQYISNFEINNEAARLEIATICAKQNGVVTAEFIENFAFSRQEDILKIQVLCVLQNHSSIKHILKNSEIYNTDRFPWITPFLQSIKDSHVQQELAASLSAAMGLLQMQLTNDQFAHFEELHIMPAIYSLHAPHLYLPLLQEVISCVKDQKRLQFLQQTIGKDKPASDCFKVCCPLLSSMAPSLSEKFATFLKKHNMFFKDGPKVRDLISCLYNLKNDDSIGLEKQNVIIKLMESNNLILRIQQLKIILDLQEGWRLKELATEEDFGQISQAAINSQVPLKDCDNAAEKIGKTFGACRNPLAIWQYTAQMHGLHYPPLIRSLGLFISSVANQTFTQVRYNPELNPHLKALHPDVLQSWIKSTVFEGGKAKPPVFDATAWLKKYQGVFLSDSFINRYLDASENNRENIAKELFVSIKSAREKVEEPLLIAQKCCLALIKAKPEDQYTRLIELQNSLLKAKMEGPLLEAVNAKITDLAPKPSNNLKVIDTDDPYDLLLSGTEVSGSCQRIGGNPKLNKGLLGYILNGQNRLLAVVNDRGKILSKAVLRLLISNDNKPVLFMENPYGDERYHQKLYDLAKAKAAAMGLPLAQAKSTLPALGSCNLSSLGGIAPFEYCDAEVGIQNNSAYTIQDAGLVFIP